MGGILGFYGGKVDIIGMRFIEIYASMPFLFILMILGNFLKPNIYILAFMYIILSGWVGICWYIRGEFYREKAKDYVSAAISMGQSNIKVMFKHILPNALTPVITFAPFAIIGYISGLVSLDYLGFGLQPPTPSWGELFSQGAANLQYWHLVIFPLIAMGATLFLITFIGEGIREAFDPKVHSRLR
jgi:microcin C transport system permease protein